MVAPGYTHPEALGLEQMAKLFEADVRIRFSAQELFGCLLDAHRPIFTSYSSKSISVTAPSEALVTWAAYLAKTPRV